MASLCSPIFYFNILINIPTVFRSIDIVGVEIVVDRPHATIPSNITRDYVTAESVRSRYPGYTDTTAAELVHFHSL